MARSTEYLYQKRHPTIQPKDLGKAGALFGEMDVSVVSKIPTTAAKGPQPAKGPIYSEQGSAASLQSCRPDSRRLVTSAPAQPVRGPL